MKRISIIAAAFFLMTTAGFAQTWNWDKAHSQLNFGVTHQTISEIDGTFGTVSATLTSSKDDFSDAVVELTADVNSINTGVEQRNTHLKSDAFFDAAKFGTLTFKSTSFKHVGGKNYQVTGDLTFHGVTKSVVLNAVFNGTVLNMQKKTVAGFKVTGTIKRSDFGIGTSFPVSIVSDEVMLNANAEFVKS
ncbi:MAG TPA: YceI family protein [Puia sp.]|jgi:polyisoprenoid-binding protein YceI